MLVENSDIMRYLTDNTQTIGGLDDCDINSIYDVPLAGLQSRHDAVRRYLYRDGIKRLVDIIASTALLVILSPIFAVLWCIIWTGGGKPLFAHGRIGRNEKPFLCYKFRTMVVDGDQLLERHLATKPAAAEQWARCLKIDDDPRITRFGAFLRRSSLDEIPQLWNVLRGDMSLVGPRPFPPLERSLYLAEARRQGLNSEEAFSLRPGITGVWQVSGRNDVSYPDRIKMDYRYIRGVSLLLDMWLLLRTIRTVVILSGR